MRIVALLPIIFALCCSMSGCNARSEASSSANVAAKVGHRRGVSPPRMPREHQGDWPCFLGPSHCAEAVGTRISLPWPQSGPTLRWTKSIGTGYSSPVVAGDRLVVFHRIDDEEIVECYSASEGKSEWQFRQPATFHSSFEYSSGPYSTPAIDANRVFAWGADGKFIALSLQTGALLWQRDISREFAATPGIYQVAASPLVEGNLVVLNVGGAENETGIVAIDKATGATCWTATSDRASNASPVAATIAGQRILFVLTGDALVALEPTTGKVFWREAFRAGNPELINATSPLVIGDLVIVSGYSVGSLVVRILPGGKHEVLRRDRRGLDSQFHNLLKWNDCVLGFSARDKSLWSFRPATGEKNRQWVSEFGRGQGVIVDGHLLIVHEDGYLSLLELSSDLSAPLTAWTSSQQLVPARCFSAPAIRGQTMWLRSDTHLAAYDLP